MASLLGAAHPLRAFQILPIRISQADPQKGADFAADFLRRFQEGLQTISRYAS
jgi:hypothetical protein